MRKCLIILALSFPAQSAELSQKLNASTAIDKGQFYPYSLTLEATPSRFLLLFNDTLSRFNDAVSTLTIGSDIPVSQAGFLYQLRLQSNESSCASNFDDERTNIDDVMTVWVDDTEMNVNDVTQAYPLEQINEGDTTLGGTKEVLLRSVEIAQEGMTCGGEVVMAVELAL